jgi:hypothetical protein
MGGVPCSNRKDFTGVAHVRKEDVIRLTCPNVAVRGDFVVQIIDKDMIGEVGGGTLS